MRPTIRISRTAPAMDSNEFFVIFLVFTKVWWTHHKRTPIQILSLVNFLPHIIDAHKYGAWRDCFPIQFVALQVHQCPAESEYLFGFAQDERIFQHFAMFGVPFHGLISNISVFLVNIFSWFIVKIRRYTNPSSIHRIQWSCKFEMKRILFGCVRVRVCINWTNPIQPYWNRWRWTIWWDSWWNRLCSIYRLHGRFVGSLHRALWSVGRNWK